LKDQDLLCLSETGSGKTLSFVLPIVNHIVNQYRNKIAPAGLALILAPTRELCIQIK
jgi:superfamily II DNA/RNA helicase